MRLEGGCYCGAIRYRADGEPRLQAQCHCRECQYITGGSPNLFISMPADGFEYTIGQPARFARDDIARPVTREFCATCGTHLTTRPNGSTSVIVKVGSLDDPSVFAPDSAIYLVDRQPFHVVPTGLREFDRLPVR